MNEKLLLSGNEAIALACVVGKVHLVTGYPGTPSTEIVDSLIKKKKKEDLKLDALWAINEKVALEMAIGVSFFGKRSVCSMKHVGLNVAADALMTFSYTGVYGGCLIVSGDDPNMFSSQNEQDNRNYASFAKIPMLEPSDSNEAFLFTLLGLEISEKLDTPVLLRTTTRVAHTTSLVDVKKSHIEKILGSLEKILDRYADETVVKNKQWNKKTIMLPSVGRIRHRWVENRMEILEKISEQIPFNRLEKSLSSRSKEKLLIASGPAYLYAKEAFPQYDIYKVSLSYPPPVQSIKKIAPSYKEVVVVEELDPFLENQLLIAGIQLRKRHRNFYCGELSVDRTRLLVNQNNEPTPSDFLLPLYTSTEIAQKAAPPNPPMLCPGCPHLTVANLLREEAMTTSGDIGCYTLAALPPFESLDTVLAMGASPSILAGMTMAYDKNSQKPPPKVAVIGDSTFLHAGIPALIEIARLNPDAVICLLDNYTTAMTGRQTHPGKSPNSTKDGGRQEIDYIQLGKVLGIKSTYKVPSYQFEHCRTVFRHALKEKGLTLIVFEESCALLLPKKEKVAEIKDTCVRCAECLEVGCPSIFFNELKQRPDIEEDTCIGCGICYAACNYNSLGDKTNANLFEFLEVPLEKKL